MSIIVLGLSKWSSQWITNFVNYIIIMQSYQNTNKITFHSNSFLFACFSIPLECCKYARMRFNCATVLVVLSICALRGNIADDAMQMDVNKSLYPFYTTKKMPHVTVTITRKRFVVSNSQVYWYYDNLHSAQSADFQRRVFLFKKALRWSVKKEELDCHGFQRKHKSWLYFA